MRVLAQRAAVAVGVVAAGAAGVVAWCARGDRPLPRAGLAAPAGPRAAGVAPSTARPPPGLAPAAPAAPDRTDRIEIAGSERTAITSAELAGRPAVLAARDRRAWRLSELLPDAYTHADSVIHALTADGKDYTLRAAGRNGGDVVVVRRTGGELYLGWLDDAGAVDAARSLGDVERPAERIERVARITVTAPATAPPQAPARLTVVIDGVPRHTLTPASFAAAARLAIAGRDAAAPAIDLAHAFGDGLAIAGMVAGGARLTTAPPTPTARAVVYLTRRARFKFAWIDAAGQPIRDSQQRELTEIALRSPAH